MTATECVICLGVLSQPKFLSCLHTFCLSCLEQLHQASNNSELTCPTCRASTVVPPEGVRGLRTNFIVDQMLEFRKLCDVTCGACADSSSLSTSAVAMAIAYCVDCSDNLCESCVSAHRKIKTLKSHRLVEVGANHDSDRRRELVGTRSVYCSDHPNQEIALYCTDCSTCICLSCCVLAHRTHSYLDIKDQASESRKGLGKVVDAVSEKLSDFRKANVELEVKLATANASSTQAINEITRRANEFIDQVRCKERALIESVQTYQHQSKKQIEATQEDLQTKIAGMENFIQLCQQLRDSGTHSDVLRLSSQICATADELRTANFGRVFLPSLVFTPANGNLSEFNVLGEVAVIETEGECTADLIEERLQNCGTSKMEDNSRNHSSTERGNINVELNAALRRDNNDPATDLPSASASTADSVTRLITSSVSEKVRATLRRENSTVENHVDCLNSSSSTILTASQKSVSEGYLSNRSLETQKSYCSSRRSSITASVDISDVSSEDQSEDDDDTDNSGHLRSGKLRSGNLDDSEGRPTNDCKTNLRRSSDDKTNRSGSRNATPPSIPLFSIAGGYFEEPQRRRRGSADIETIPGVEPIVGVALLDYFLFVLRRNSNELELYDHNSLNLVGRESIKELVQPMDLTACARTHTLYIGHTRKIVFSVKVSGGSTLSLQKLSVAFNYTHLSTTYNCSVLMGCPKAETILEYKKEPHWKLVRCIKMPGTYPTGMVQLSPNRFAVSSKTNVVYIITEEGPNSTCEEVSVPHNMSHMAIDISGTHLLVADCYGHQIRRLEPGCQGKARSSLILETKTISKPCRLWTDTVGRRLFVGTTQGDVKVLHLD